MTIFKTGIIWNVLQVKCAWIYFCTLPEAKVQGIQADGGRDLQEPEQTPPEEAGGQEKEGWPGQAGSHTGHKVSRGTYINKI